MRLMIPAISVSLLSALSPPKIIDQGVPKELDDLGLEPWRHLTKLHTDLLSSPARSRCAGLDDRSLTDRPGTAHVQVRARPGAPFRPRCECPSSIGPPWPRQEHQDLGTRRLLA